MLRILGLLCILAGFYFIGQNIIFTTSRSPSFWMDVAANGAALVTLLGILTIIFGGSDTRSLGYGLLGVGALLIFLSGRVFLRPTSLFHFTAGFLAMAAGWYMFSSNQPPRFL